MSNDIYSYIESNFGIKITDYQFKRDYIKEPLKKLPINTPTGYTLEKPFKEDLEYLYLTLNLKRDIILSFFNVSCTTFKRWCKKMKIKKSLYQIEENAEKGCYEKYGVRSFSQTDEYRIMLDKKRELWKELIYQGLKKSGNYGKSISKEEKYIFNMLKQKYPNVICQYKSKLYPFKCDFYISELDLYIEYQGFWKHGLDHFWYNNKKYNCHCPYDSNNLIHQKLVEFWQNKNTDYYNSAIKIWTVSDPLKRKIAKINNLNYLEFFTIDEFLDWFNEI